MLSVKSFGGARIYRGMKGSWQMGEFSSTATGKGLKLSASRTSVHRIYGDTGGAALAAGVYRPSLSRFLIDYAFSANVSAFGFQGQMKVNADVTADFLAGIWGYAEVTAGKTITGSIAGVRGTVDMPATAVIAANQIASAFLADSIDINCTHTGKAVPLHVPTVASGAWDALVALGATTGCNITSFSGNDAFVPNSKGTFTQQGQIKILVGGTTYYIPYGSVE